MKILIAARALRAPNVFNGLGLAQGHESLISRRRVLRTEKPQARHLCDVRHPVVLGIHAECPKMGKRNERLEAGGRDREVAVVDIEAEEPIESP